MKLKKDGTPTESEIGKALTKYYRTRWPKLRLHFMHIPNGAHLAGNKQQRARQMNRLKTEGLLPGVSDYFISLPTEDYCGLWLEIKSRGKEPTKEQLEFLDAQYSAGYATEWADNIDDCIDILEWYMDMVYAVRRSREKAVPYKVSGESTHFTSGSVRVGDSGAGGGAIPALNPISWQGGHSASGTGGGAGDADK